MPSMALMARPALWSLLAVLLLFGAACGEQPAEEPVAEEPAGDATEAATPDGATEGGNEPSATAAAADGAGSACTDLEGSTITFVVPYDAGGGYDTYARLIAPVLEEEIGATVVVENQPGAGGLLAINSLLAAPADGTTIAIMNAVGSGAASIAGAEGAQFELDELSYIGRVTDDRKVLVTGGEGEFTTFQEMLDAESIRIGSNGPGSADFVSSVVLNAIFEDLDGEIITGFDGSEEVALTLVQGELDAMSGSLSSRLSAIENGDERPVLMFSPRPVEALPDTPALLELDLDQRQRDLATAYLSLLDLGRAIVAPPDVPAGPLGCLRTALGEALSDPELLAQAEQQDRPIEHLGGEEMDQLIADVASAPEEFQQVITEAH